MLTTQRCLSTSATIPPSRLHKTARPSQQTARQTYRNPRGARPHYAAVRCSHQSATADCELRDHGFAVSLQLGWFGPLLPCQQCQHDGVQMALILTRLHFLPRPRPPPPPGRPRRPPRPHPRRSRSWSPSNHHQSSTHHLSSHHRHKHSHRVVRTADVLPSHARVPAPVGSPSVCLKSVYGIQEACTYRASGHKLAVLGAGGSSGRKQGHER